MCNGNGTGALEVTEGMTSQVTDNREKSRFELDVAGQIAFANYRRQGATLVIPHVEAPLPLRGTGAAGRLMQGVMEIARAEGLRVVPLCGYASAWIRRHKQYRDLLA
jgi:predicted GNAT family acetyltransferase